MFRIRILVHFAPLTLYGQDVRMAYMERRWFGRWLNRWFMKIR